MADAGKHIICFYYFALVNPIWTDASNNIRHRIFSFLFVMPPLEQIPNCRNRKNLLNFLESLRGKGHPCVQTPVMECSCGPLSARVIIPHYFRVQFHVNVTLPPGFGTFREKLGSCGVGVSAPFDPLMALSDGGYCLLTEDWLVKPHPLD